MPFSFSMDPSVRSGTLFELMKSKRQALMSLSGSRHAGSRSLLDQPDSMKAFPSRARPVHEDTHPRPREFIQAGETFFVICCYQQTAAGTPSFCS